VVPEVGQGREREAALTLEGLERLMALITKSKPDCLLVLSPHQPYAPGALFVNGAPLTRGSFIPFGASVSFTLNTASSKLRPLAGHLASKGMAVRTGDAQDLTRDQGTLVPLYFMRKAWGDLPSVILASPIGLEPEKAFNLGEALASFEDGTSWALLASGDLSHRLTPNAPAGYSPVGKKFDAAVVAALSSADPQGLLDMALAEREEAGECGLRSVLAMLGLCRVLGRTIELLSYEGPFGVGYCNAFSS
jgi:aromatic ring-opening dioxygenase LigB subunit